MLPCPICTEDVVQFINMWHACMLQYLKEHALEFRCYLVLSALILPNASQCYHFVRIKITMNIHYNSGAIFLHVLISKCSSMWQFCALNVKKNMHYNAGATYSPICTFVDLCKASTRDTTLVPISQYSHNLTDIIGFWNCSLSMQSRFPSRDKFNLKIEMSNLDLLPFVLST